MVNFTLQFTTNKIVSISTSQTFCSWVVIYHHRQPMACLSLNLHDTPGLAPSMIALFWRPGDFPVAYSNRDISWKRLKSSFWKFYDRYCYLIQQYEVSLSFWPLTNRDFPTDHTFHQFHDLHTELGLHRFMSGFQGAFATVVACKKGMLTLPDT